MGAVGLCHHLLLSGIGYNKSKNSEVSILCVTTAALCKPVAVVTATLGFGLC